MYRNMHLYKLDNVIYSMVSVARNVQVHRFSSCILKIISFNQYVCKHVSTITEKTKEIHIGRRFGSRKINFFY